MSPKQKDRPEAVSLRRADNCIRVESSGNRSLVAAAAPGEQPTCSHQKTGEASGSRIQTARGSTGKDGLPIEPSAREARMVDKDKLAREIIAFSDLLVIVLTGPDSDSAKDGMYEVAHEISARARELKKALDDEMPA
jgi:hypothetical protein